MPDAALLLPLTSVSWVWSSAIFLSYIIFLSDTMAIKLNRISPSLYLKREKNTLSPSTEWYTVKTNLSSKVFGRESQNTFFTLQDMKP